MLQTDPVTSADPQINALIQLSIVA